MAALTLSLVPGAPVAPSALHQGLRTCAGGGGELLGPRNRQSRSVCLRLRLGGGTAVTLNSLQLRLL